MADRSKQEKIQQFNPSGIGSVTGGIFGLPFNYEDSDLILLPVPWEVTVSYQAGTAKAPDAIRKASPQLDLYDHDYPEGWKHGIFLQKASSSLKKINTETRKIAAAYIGSLEKGEPANAEIVKEVDAACEKMINTVYNETKKIRADNKWAGLLGGDHSTPLGYWKALADDYDTFGILHIDAHADLREKYEGFQYSHASIFYNALSIPQISKIVQVGVRDICEEEIERIKNSNRRIVTFFDHELHAGLFQGIQWSVICKQIVNELPQKVHISFDIDGLDPKLCPNTGTAVPGGLDLPQVFYLLNEVVASGREIIGFDLVEVVPGKDEWDANVGARVLYKLCNLLLKSKSGK